MKILFDNQIFKAQQFGGISRYFSELMNGINENDTFEFLPKKFYTTNLHLRDKQLSRYNTFVNLTTFRGKARISKLLEKQEDRSISKLIAGGKYDVFHPTYYHPSFINTIGKKPFILTVHDMIHELYLDPLFSKTHQETLGRRILIPKAKHIIAVSENTKKDILKLYPTLAPDKITVIHHGPSFAAVDHLSTLKFNQPYLLYVGLRAHYKNFNWLIKNLDKYLIENNINLICAGGGKFNDEETALLQKLKLKERVQQLPIANDTELFGLYKNAKCFIFPSLYEGFGIPILEAFAADCPVLVNNKSCFPEIAGKGALYFDSEHPESLLLSLQKLDNQELRNSLITAGQLQLEQFSWKNTVAQHLQIYTS